MKLIILWIGIVLGESAIFAGGCFWCMEGPFDKLDGVIETTSGFSGGDQKNPKYKDVAQGKTNHKEVVEVKYDPKKISYEELLRVYWRQINPTDDGGQFADRGSHYSTAIYYKNKKQKVLAEKSKKDLQATGRFEDKIVTEILKAGVFYPAEENHQNYYLKKPGHYKSYRKGSGREDYLKKTWSKKYIKPSKKHLKKYLTPLQYRVTQEDGTERAWKNPYWNKKEDGIYVDIVSGEPLFSSKDKYDSKTGWPSFSQALVPENVTTKADGFRTEIRSVHGDSHLGHVFTDGPKPKGLRFCINSASLRFIPVKDLKKFGYEQFLDLFKK